MVAKHIAVKSTFSYVVDTVFGIPVTFLVSYDECAVRIKANTVCCAETIGNDLGFTAVGAYLE